MKRLLLIFALGLATISNAQDPELTDNDWYVDYIVLDGINYPTPITNPIGPINTNIDFEADQLYAIIHPESDSFFSLINYSNPNEFILTEMAITLPGCQAFCEFAGNYFTLLFGDSNENAFTYNITTLDDVKILTITSQDGNIAVFNDEPILSVKNNNLTSISIFPNPTSNQLFIVSERLEIEAFTVYDISGKQVLRQQNTDNAVDVSNLPKGMYFLEASSNEGKSIEKFIKK